MLLISILSVLLSSIVSIIKWKLSFVTFIGTTSLKYCSRLRRWTIPQWRAKEGISSHKLKNVVLTCHCLLSSYAFSVYLMWLVFLVWCEKSKEKALHLIYPFVKLYNNIYFETYFITSTLVCILQSLYGLHQAMIWATFFFVLFCEILFNLLEYVVHLL